MSQSTAVEKNPVRPEPVIKGAVIQTEIDNYEKRIALLEKQVRHLKPYKKMAVIDHLTHIFNRRYFDTRLEEEIARMTRRGFPFCVAILDLDHFKRINDTYGHGIGDLILRDFANFLTTNLRRVDVVCRIGGEEFAVIMPETDITAGLAIMERILEELINHPFSVKQYNHIHISFSCGIVSNSQSLMGTSEVLEVADQALYEAKRGGRRQVMARCC